MLSKEELAEADAMPLDIDVSDAKLLSVIDRNGKLFTKLVVMSGCIKRVSESGLADEWAYLIEKRKREMKRDVYLSRKIAAEESD